MSNSTQPRRFDKFLVVTDVSRGAKLLIDVEDIEEVREMLQGKGTEIIRKSKFILQVTDKFEDVIAAIASFSPYTMMEDEIKAVIDAINEARGNEEDDVPPLLNNKNKKNIN